MAEKLRILVVDDEEVMCNLLSDVLTEAGYKVKAVSSGEKALQEIKEDIYNIVIADLKMPGISGMDVIKEAKQIKRDMWVIAITAYPSIKSAVEVMRHGAFDYIVKPFDVEEIRLVVHRVSERHYLLKEVEQKDFSREMIISDALTKLYNHRRFHEVLPCEIERARRYSQPFSLLMIDIDDFKRYNDTKGPLAGDKLLADLANLLASTVRTADVVFRYGGEEFVAFLPQVGHAGAAVAAKRILDLTSKKLSITVSVGLASFPDDGTTKDELINKVDSAMRQAKQLGKNKIYVCGEKVK